MGDDGLVRKFLSNDENQSEFIVSHEANNGDVRIDQTQSWRSHKAHTHRERTGDGECEKEQKLWALLICVLSPSKHKQQETN